MRKPASPDDAIHSYSRRLTVMALGCALLGAAVVLRASTIQILGDDRLARLASRQFQSKLLIRPRRGQISDRNGEALAVNVEVKSLAADPSKIRDPRRAAARLASALRLPQSKLAQRLRSKRSFVWIQRHMTDAQLAALKKQRFMDAGGDLPDGFWLVQEIKRVYPHGDVASQVIGNVNIDSDGIEGAELWMNDRLRGEVVSLDAYKDALGRPTFIDAVAAKHVRDGLPVRLTLDAPLQFAVERELRSAVERTRSQAGSVLVMDADSGEILAMANYPGYNANRKGVSAAAKRNRLITDGFEPGSTIKPLMVAAALKGGWNITDRLHGEKGKFTVQGRTISEAEAHEQFEYISLSEMIQYSSNVVAAKLALKLGPKKVTEALKMFGFGARTGLGFPGEISGWLAPPDKLQPLQLANIGFGQGIMATRIQVARAYAAILNGGYLVKPTLVVSEPKEGEAPAKPKRVLDESVARRVRKALLEATSEEGTGNKARYGEYLIAGKTGTAQLVDAKTKSYSAEDYIASFVGFALDVEPRIVILTTLDHPRTSIYASETAAPLFREVFREVATRFHLPAPVSLAKTTPEEMLKDRLARDAAAPDRLPAIVKPDLKAILEGDGNAMEQAMEKADASGEALSREMPSLLGLSAREALLRMGTGGFRLELDGFGVVVSQRPEPGEPVTPKTVVRVRLSEKSGLR